MVILLFAAGGFAGLTLIAFLILGERRGEEPAWQVSIRRRVQRERLEARAYVDGPESERLEREQAEREAIEARLEAERKVAHILEAE